MNTNDSQEKFFDIIVVGAGAAGLGVSIILQKLGLNYTILEKSSVAASFKKWPKETRFISPSFTGNFFKAPDLNAITPDTSPAFTLSTQHPSGKEYAHYLEELSAFYKLPVQTGVEISSVKKNDGVFTLQTNKGDYQSTSVIWAAGEFQYPKTASFPGSDLCTHYAKISSFADVEGDDIIVIGGYEAGFDSAANLVKAGKKVTVFDSSDYLGLVTSDSSYSLSPCTRDRIRDAGEGITHHKETRVKEVTFADGVYTITTENGKTVTTKNKPIDCTGFSSSLALVQDHFDFDDGYPLLNDFDESQKTENLFLVGPQVKHGSALFCFIYKYRQRFAIVAEKLSERNDIPPEVLKEVIQEYKDNNFYLKDFSCCDSECVC